MVPRHASIIKTPRRNRESKDTRMSRELPESPERCLALEKELELEGGIT
jgi:hypothetical protein